MLRRLTVPLRFDERGNTQEMIFQTTVKRLVYQEVVLYFLGTVLFYYSTVLVGFKYCTFPVLVFFWQIFFFFFQHGFCKAVSALYQQKRFLPAG